MRRGEWLGTRSGKKFYPIDPKPEDVDLKDIALALSRICRFNGHTSQFYSVADHCINVQQYLSLCGASTKIQLYGLLHDAAEAYVCDIPRPLKIYLVGYAEIEKGVQKAIYEAFNLREPYPVEADFVKHADDYLLAVEAKELMHVTNDWKLAKVPLGEVAPSYRAAEKIYIHYAKELLKKYREEENEINRIVEQAEANS